MKIRKMIMIVILVCLFSSFIGSKAYSKEVFNPFNSNEKEYVIWTDSIVGIGSEKAISILSELYPDYTCGVRGSFRRMNGDEYYYMILKDFVDEHWTTLSYFFLSADGKVCVEGWSDGENITAYNNKNLLADKNNVTAKKYYSVAQTGIGSYLTGEEGCYYEKYYTIDKIKGKKIKYREILNLDIYSKNKTAKLSTNVKCYAIDTLFYKKSSLSKKKAVYMYKISKKKALSAAKKYRSSVWMKIIKGKITAIVINAEKTAN